MSKKQKIEIVINELKTLLDKKGLTYEVRSKIKEDEDTGFYSFTIQSRKGLIRADFEWDDSKYGVLHPKWSAYVFQQQHNMSNNPSFQLP